MKVKELLQMKGVWSGAPMKIRNLYDDPSKVLASTKVTAQTVTIKNSVTGEVIGKRTIYQK